MWAGNERAMNSGPFPMEVGVVEEMWRQHDWNADEWQGDAMQAVGPDI